jgi:hypothetical protein
MCPIISLQQLFVPKKKYALHYSILPWPEMEITMNKIHRLGYRFSINFYIHTIRFGFLLGNHNIWQNS